MKTIKNYQLLGSAEIGSYAEQFMKQAVLLKDKSERQEMVENLVEFLSENSQSSSKLQEESKQKMWLQLLEVVDYQIDIKIPDNLPARATQLPKVKIGYTPKIKKFRQYGIYLQQMIAQIALIEEKLQPEFIKNTIIFMKQIYQQNNDQAVSNEEIINDFKLISKLKIDFDNYIDFDNSETKNDAVKSKKSINFIKKPKNLHRKK